MKNKLILFLLPALLLMLNSCSAIAGIFKAGVGVGIIIVVAIIALIIFFVSRSGKK